MPSKGPLTLSTELHHVTERSKRRRAPPHAAKRSKLATTGTLHATPESCTFSGGTGPWPTLTSDSTYFLFIIKISPTQQAYLPIAYTYGILKGYMGYILKDMWILQLQLRNTYLYARCLFFSMHVKYLSGWKWHDPCTLVSTCNSFHRWQQ